LKALAVALVIIGLAGCSLLGLDDSPAGAADVLARAYTAVIDTREVTLARLEARTISPVAAQHMQARLDSVRGVLDAAARRLDTSAPGAEPEDIAAGQSALVQAVTVLAALRACVDVTTLDFADCIAGAP
jgi:hypothetical protein